MNDSDRPYSAQAAASPQTFAEYVSTLSDAELEEIIAVKEHSLACAQAERRRRALAR